MSEDRWLAVRSSVARNARNEGVAKFGLSSERPLRQTIIRAAMGIILAMGGISGMAQAEDTRSRIDADGTIHVRELTIPPSDLWSPEFKKYHADRVARMAESIPPLPARGAPEAEWDQYISWANARSTEFLAPALELYSITVEDTNMAGVRVGIVTPKQGIAPENQRRVLINLRGGGFVYGHGLTAGLFDSIPVAAIGRIKVITLDYRQAPFHCYPAASEDVEAVYRELLKHYKAEAIGIYGCSAGGTLTAQAAAWFQAKGLPRPGAIGIHGMGLSSPQAPGIGDAGMWWSLMHRPSPSAEGTSSNPIGWYMEGVARDDPNAYPGASDTVLAQFPPTLFLTGTRAFDMSILVTTHTRFLKLGVDASLYLMEGATHCDHLGALGTPEAHDAYAYVARWFDQHLAR